MQRQRLMLTRKLSLLKSKERPLSEYSSELVGRTATGVLVSRHSSGGAVFSFYGNVHAFMFPRQVQRLGDAKIGSTVQVRVARVEPEAKRMVVILAEQPSACGSETALAPTSSAVPLAALPEIQEHSEASPKVKKVPSKMGKKVKPFVIYTSKVVSFWSRGTTSKCAVELEMPDGSVGRLHASELDDSMLEKGSRPLEIFLHENRGKMVNVKVIGIGKIREEAMESANPSKPSVKKLKLSAKKVSSVLRVAECTLRSEKLMEPRKKQSLVGYAQSFTHGSVIPVFVKEGPRGGTIKVEASPLWNGVIRKQNIGDKKLVTNPVDRSSALIDLDFEPGEMLQVRVMGVCEAKKRAKRGRHRKCLELTLVDPQKQIRANERVEGRVIAVTESPATVVFELANDQRAAITATGVTGRYMRALEHMRSFSLNEVYYIYLLRFDEESGRWLALTEDRYNSWRSGATKRGHSKLVINGKDLEENAMVKAFVTSVAKDHVYAEVGPGVTGRLEKRETVNLHVDQLVTARVLRVFGDGRLKLLFMGANIKGDFVEVTDTEEPRLSNRKRTASSGSESSMDRSQKKSKSAGFSITDSNSLTTKPVEAEVVDPGFDWSLKGFTPAELAAVGQIGEELDVTKLEKPAKSVVDADGGGEQHVESAAVERKRPKTKEERLLEKEKTLVNREATLLDPERAPGSAEEFDRLLAGNPNSSELWIRFISLFLEKKNVERARAVAERALSVIHFREEDEVFNLWTAYLNLEVNYGTQETLKAVFERAIKNADSLKMHKQMLKIYQNNENIQAADEVLEEMLKRFRHEDIDVWFLYGQHLMETSRADKARDLLKRAMKSVAQKNHVSLLSRFAQMEYKFGDAEQGKTVFESILDAYPKKTDVWNVYIDMVVKHAKYDEARQLFDRVTSLNLHSHKMRSLLKKWLEFEEKHGDEEKQKMVKERALRFVEGASTDVELRN